MKYLSIAEEDDISWSIIQASFSSIAQTAIVPMQDILGLGSSARMNTPATVVSHSFYIYLNCNEIEFFFIVVIHLLELLKSVSNNVVLVDHMWNIQRRGTGVGGFRVRRALIIWKLNLTDYDIFCHCTDGFEEIIRRAKRVFSFLVMNVFG